VLLVDGDAAGIEFSDAIAVNIRANHLVSGFGETSSGDQADVATSNNRKTQDELSL
jgi:hypothetical protein